MSLASSLLLAGLTAFFGPVCCRQHGLENVKSFTPSKYSSHLLPPSKMPKFFVNEDTRDISFRYYIFFPETPTDFRTFPLVIHEMHIFILMWRWFCIGMYEYTCTCIVCSNHSNHSKSSSEGKADLSLEQDWATFQTFLSTAQAGQQTNSREEDHDRYCTYIYVQYRSWSLWLLYIATIAKIVRPPLKADLFIHFSSKLDKW